MTRLDTLPHGFEEHRLTLEEALSLGAAGALNPDRRWELIDGRIVYMASEGGLHIFAVAELMRIFTTTIYGDPVLSARLRVYAHATARLSKFETREPDLMIAAPPPAQRVLEPMEIELLVEAAVSSARYDLETKRREYAVAGVREYWVWEAEKARLHVFRRPDGGDYLERAAHGVGDVVSPVAIPQIRLAIAELIPPGA